MIGKCSSGPPHSIRGFRSSEIEQRLAILFDKQNKFVPETRQAGIEKLAGECLRFTRQYEYHGLKVAALCLVYGKGICKFERFLHICLPVPVCVENATYRLSGFLSFPFQVSMAEQKGTTVAV